MLLFVSVLGMLAWRTRNHVYIFGAFVGVLIMNIFLHSFESMHSSLLMFIFVASLIPLQFSDKKL